MTLHAAARCFIALFALAALAGCGFAPVYAPAPVNNGPIHVAEIEGRAGHFLRQELVRTVGRGVPGVDGSAKLTVLLTESIGRLGFAPDQAASRSDYRGTATWQLRDSAGRLIASGGARESASFNFADAAYADVTAQAAAQERVASMLARSIRDELIIQAEKPRTASARPPGPPPPAP